MGYRKVETEDAILNRVSGIDLEDLVILRIEVGHEYAKKFGEEVASEYIQTRAYWNWWLRIWEINDKKLLDRINRSRMDTVDLDYYHKHHRVFSRKFNMCDVVGRVINETRLSNKQKQLV